MFVYLDNKREKFNSYLKNKTTIDFSDWGIFILFFIGLFAIFYFGIDFKPSDKISIIVLWFTAIVVMQYTKETYWLKRINVKSLNYQKRPIMKISCDTYHTKGYFMLKNIGNGPAINLRLMVSHINHDGNLINTKYFDEHKSRGLLNVGNNEEKSAFIKREIMSDYISEENNLFAVIAQYEDISGKSYHTVIHIKSKRKSNNLILQGTIIHEGCLSLLDG